MSEDYCPEEEEKEEQEEEKAIGPKCDVCGKSTDSLYPVLVKREIRGMFEMVQIYLCAVHYCERMEEDATPPEDEEKSVQDILNEIFGDGEEEEEDDDEDNDGGWSSTTVDHIGQSWG